MRVCIVYEHSLFAHGIKGLLARDPALRMVGMVERSSGPLEAVRRLRPEVVVLEGDGGMAVLESLDGVMGVAISLRGEEATIFTGLPVRVSGPSELAGAIRSAARRGRRGRPAAR